MRGRFKLPPKRILFHGPDDEFMEARREWLDSYLQAVLADETLRTLSEARVPCRAGWLVRDSRGRPLRSAGR